MKTTDLKSGQSLLTSIRKVNGGKYQIEVAEIIVNPTAKTNLLSKLNADDDRFGASQPKARRAWMTVTAAMIMQYFGIDVATLTFEGDKQIAEVNALNPSVEGQRLGVQLKDTLIPNYNNRPKLSTRKVNGVDVTEIFTLGGKPIYQETEIVVASECKHTILNRDGVMSSEDFDLYSAKVAVGGVTENLASGE